MTSGVKKYAHPVKKSNAIRPIIDEPAHLADLAANDESFEIERRPK